MSRSSSESVISRVIRLIDAFDRNTRSMSLTALANRAGLPLSTTYRLVNELSRYGLLERDNDKDISLGLRLWEMTSKGAQALPLREAALLNMVDLQSYLGRLVTLAVLDSGTVLYLEQLSGGGPEPGAGRMADRFSIHASSSGMLLLAYSSADYQDEILSRPLARLTDQTVVDPDKLRIMLANIRRQRYAHMSGMGVAEWSGAAVPIFGPNNKAVAALNVAHVGGGQLRSIVPIMQISARSISRALGASESADGPIRAVLTNPWGRSG